MDILKEWKDIIIKNMNKRVSRLLFAVVISVGLIVIFSFVKEHLSHKLPNPESEYTYYDFAMGSSFSYTLYGEGDNAKNISDKISNCIKGLDEEIISWRNNGSELNTINTSYKVGEEITISQDMHIVLSGALDLCNASSGALDITIRPLAELWNIEQATEENFVVPASDSIKATLGRLGYEYIDIIDDKLIINREDMALDLGAVGKGYVLDKIHELLVAEGVDNAIITAGGSVLVIGSKPDNTSWKIGIRDPKGDIDDMIGYVVIDSEDATFISTSGDYEKFIEKDGCIYHHILDCTTGYPAESSYSSVTIVCDNGLVSDGLSTACYILGYEDSKELLSSYNAEALFIDRNNNIYVTDGLEFVRED